MAIEIERKFLVANDGWRDAVVRSELLQDGLIASTNGRKVRVRIYGSRATLTVKSVMSEMRRMEFEYEIPTQDARVLITDHCGGATLTKMRHYAPFRGFMWEIDVYEEPLDGIVIAEVELTEENIALPIPSWAGAEVTGMPEYRKVNLVTARRRRNIGL